MYVSVLVIFCLHVFSSFFFIFFVYFYCSLMISICFPTDFMPSILKNARNSTTSAKKSKVQTKPNQHIMADHFRVSELVTLAPGPVEVGQLSRNIFRPMMLRYFLSASKRPVDQEISIRLKNI